MRIQYLSGILSSIHQKKTFCTSECSDMDLKSVVKKLQQFADPSLAESWDNVGLLVEPTPPHEVYPVSGCLGIYLTNE